MTTQRMLDIAAKVKSIDPRISAHAEGGMISGCFRGKKSETYSL